MRNPTQESIRAAISAACLSPCRSKRGVALIYLDTVLATGCNYQVAPFVCDGSDECKAKCRHTAIHAEQVVLLGAGTLSRNCDLLHVKVVDGNLVPSGGPSCVQCSKLAVAAGIAGVWLFHESGWKRYPVEEFHRLSAARASA